MEKLPVFGVALGIVRSNLPHFGAIRKDYHFLCGVGREKAAAALAHSTQLARVENELPLGGPRGSREESPAAAGG
jgi:hypothetical protein